MNPDLQPTTFTKLFSNNYTPPEVYALIEGAAKCSAKHRLIPTIASDWRSPSTTTTPDNRQR